MITVCHLNKCAGCKGCIHKCPRGAIHIEDSIEAMNAIIEESLCINCNACHDVCPVNNPPEFKKTKYWIQGWSEIEELRCESSSGGVATALSNFFLRDGGVVCSCSYKNGKFIFTHAKSIDEVTQFVGSKYVKSNPDDVYEENMSILKSGKKLLFIGLPCQVAGMKNYLGCEFDEQVYFVELICHGSPSPKVLESFFASNGLNILDIQNINFRKKMDFHVYTNNDKYQKCVPDSMRDLYSFTFLKGLTYTENCYTCNYARTERIADITLGDSWGSSLSNEEKRKGISLIMCQTDRGYNLVKEANIHIEDVDREKSIASNKQLREPSSMPFKRTFFIRILKKKGFNAAVRKTYPLKYSKYMIKKTIYCIKRKLKSN